MKKWLALIALLSVSSTLFAYPDTMAAKVELGIGKAVDGFAISSDNRYIYSANGKQLSRFDTGTFALTADQPPELSEDDGNDGNIKSIVYSSSANAVYAVLDTGKLVTYTTTNITAIPTSQTISSGVSLGPLSLDTATSTFFAGYQSNYALDRFVNGSGSTTSADLKGAVLNKTFTINDVFFNSNTNEIYIATSIGYIIYLTTAYDTPVAILMNDAQDTDLRGLAMPYNTSPTLYAPSNNKQEISSVNMEGHSRRTPITVNSSDNSSFVSIAMQEISGSANVYGYVSGQKGITVFNTSNDELIDIGGSQTEAGRASPIATDNISGPLVASTDGYVYMSYDTGIAVITDKPWVQITDVIYYDSTGTETTLLKQHGTMVFTLESDTTGTYKFYAGGSIDMSGHLMTDVNGQTSGTVTADTPLDVTFSYDTNVSYLEGGLNTIFAFVTDSGNLTGRGATTIGADIPPAAVTILSTGFGDQRAYLNFQRLTATNVSYYKLYADTDPSAVITKVTSQAVVNQPSSGSTVSGAIDGLTNGTTYYLAIEGVNTAGTVGPRTYLLPDGTRASSIPQQTVGPAGYSGETGGCSLIRGAR